MKADVAIVGASLAGCAAARLFAQAGASVALIERRPDPEAYKVICTHAIQPSATPAIERLGLAPLLEARGARRTGGYFWNPHSGWITIPEDIPRAWGVTRRTLDPMVRRLAADTPGVELMLGRAATGLDGTRLRVESPDGGGETVEARLVVGADGRGSTVARLAGVRGRVRRHNRFFYFAYWTGLQPMTHVRGWLLDPDNAAQFPNEDDLTLLAVGATKADLPEFRADPEAAYARRIRALPDAPDLAAGERVSKLVGKIDMPNVWRAAAHDDVAFCGDAAVASDPLWGVGCGWAFQTAEWLVDETAHALDGGSGLGDGLERYRRVVLRRLGIHHLVMSEFASGRRTNPPERAYFRAAARDEAVARAMGEVAGRFDSPLRLFRPGTVARVVRAQVG